MPKYWQSIAVNAQEEAALYAAEARLLREKGSAGWKFYAEKSAALYARARWAASAPDDCP